MFFSLKTHKQIQLYVTVVIYFFFKDTINSKNIISVQILHQT